MSRFSPLAAVAAALCLATPAFADGPIKARPGPVDPATALLPGETIDLIEGARLFMPADVDAGGGVPLLVLLPATGSPAIDMVEPLRSRADAAGIALLAFDPEGSEFRAVRNHLRDRSDARDTATQHQPRPRFGIDAKRLEQALGAAFERVEVDPDRIGLLGFARGGDYALMVGTANPDLFSTIAAIAPGPLVIPPKPKRGQSILIAHGIEDRVHAYEESRCISAPRLAREGHRVMLRSFEGGHHVPIAVKDPIVTQLLAGRAAGPDTLALDADGRCALAEPLPEDGE